MKNRKRFLCLLTLALFTLSLLAGCGSSDRKWSSSDVIDGYGTVTRDGKQIDVCVTHDQNALYLYYDDKDHKLFDTVMLPTDELYDQDWLITYVNSIDLTGDNNSDLYVFLLHSDSSESYIEWAWEEGEGYVYQPDFSQFYEPIQVFDPYDTIHEIGLLEGIWLGDADNQYDYIEIDADGFWQLYACGDVIDDGYLWYDAESYAICVCSYQGGAADGGYVDAGDDWLCITTLGYFHYADGMEDYWYEAGGED